MPGFQLCGCLLRSILAIWDGDRNPRGKERSCSSVAALHIPIRDPPLFVWKMVWFLLFWFFKQYGETVKILGKRGTDLFSFTVSLKEEVTRSATCCSPSTRRKKPCSITSVYVNDFMQSSHSSITDHFSVILISV